MIWLLLLFCEIGTMPPGVSDAPVICIPHPDVDSEHIDGVRVWLRLAPDGEWHQFDLPAQDVPAQWGYERVMPGLCPCSDTDTTHGVKWPLVRLMDFPPEAEVDVSAAFYNEAGVIDPPEMLTETAESCYSETGWGAVTVCWNEYQEFFP